MQTMAVHGTAEERRLFRVDRETELEQCVDCLYSRRTNLIVHGDMGVGKTFLVRLVNDKLSEDHSNALSCYLNLVFAGIYGDESLVSEFPNAVLREICVTIWPSILKRDYSELRASTVESPGALKWPDKAVAKVSDIYRHLMLTKRMFQYSRENTFGASAVLKGEGKEVTSNQWHPSEILPFEFFHFLDELFDVVLHKYSIQRIVLICDEANKLPLFQQKELLLRYLELFAARNVQFLMVVRSEISVAAKMRERPTILSRRKL
jgi:Cdc6-like AAA superfamily ATPase